ncbi:MAG TPA: hypothetical protein VGJ66_00965 [Pyrinomonadaceae bacterium]|jgi:hypothetical protein
MLKRILILTSLGLTLCLTLSSSSRIDRSVSALAFNFPSARDNPPAGWTGPVFKLSQNYPTTAPTPEVLPWKAFDFKTQPIEYIKAVLAYGLEGNVEVEFQGQLNNVRKWYHAPWMHPGREFIHGMTHERSSRPKELAPTQTGMFQNWAVGLYNAPAAFAIGKVWANPNSPDPSLARFPDGAMALKLLFTQAPVSQVPYLKNDFQWLADINRISQGGAPPEKLRLLQIDVAVRDTRADSTTGWVFGTFIYDSEASGSTPWQRLVPIGLMWGNDPSKVIVGGTLNQTFINPGQRIPQHLGFKGRLNGPVDNPVSSCLSCHSTAAMSLDPPRPTISGVPPANPTSAQLKSYFRNILSGTPFTPGYTSLDYSLQLQVGIANLVGSGGFQPPAPPHGLMPPGAAARVNAARQRAINVIVPMERDGTPERRRPH